MTDNFLKTNSNFPDCSDFTLIIPSVSVGNVPQLTADLLVSSTNLRQAASVWHPAITPIIGSDPYTDDSSIVCTACELYLNEAAKLGVLQLRSAIEVKLALEFTERLKEEILRLGFAKVVILLSGFAHERHDVGASAFRYVSSDGGEDCLEKLGFKKWEEDLGALHGGGFGIKLFEKLRSEVSCVVLFKYVSEGDNTSDALQVLDVLCKYLGNVQVEQVKMPSSWRFLFGNCAPVGIY